MTIFLIVLLGVFIQATAGFGVSLMTMPLLVLTVGLHVAAPLMALVALTVRVVMMFRYRLAFSWREVWPLMVASAVGMPVGFYLSTLLDQKLVEMLLGIVIIAYALYVLITPRIPSLNGWCWPMSLGAASGMLFGAYNIASPPLIVYGTGRNWPPSMFKGNLQLVSLITNLLVISTRGFNGQYSGEVVGMYVMVLPALALGIAAGFSLDSFLKPLVFRRMVLVLLMIVGLQLIMWR